MSLDEGGRGKEKLPLPKHTARHIALGEAQE